MSFNTFVDTTLLFFNFISLNVGTYFILNNYEDLNTKTGIQDCYNIFLLAGLSVINNLIPLIGCSQIDTIMIISFLGSLGMGSYNTYNLYIVDYNCSNYYEKNILLFGFTIVRQLDYNYSIYYYIFSNNLSSKEKKCIDRESEVLINNTVGLNETSYPTADIYDDTEDENFYDGLLVDNLIPVLKITDKKYLLKMIFKNTIK